MEKKKKGKRHPILWVLIILCICVMLFSGYQLLNQLWAYQVAVNEYSDLAEAVSKDTVSIDGEIPIDFEALEEVNRERLAWIVIEDTNIDYPIVQGTDNDYYLHHTINGTNSSSGAIFMDYRNMPDFSDQNTIIYGHNMKNGSMFRDLSEYKSQSFYDTHPTFTIYTMDKTYTCEVMAAYVSAPDGAAYTLSFEDDEEFVSFQNSAIASSQIQTGVTAGAGERIVTLSTCDYTYNNARMVVQARIIE